MPELINLEKRAQELIEQGRKVGITGGHIKLTDDGHGIEIHAPVARRGDGAALLVNKHRTAEFDADLRPVCTKCRFSRDIIIVIAFPGDEDADPLQFCRDCLDRPSNTPLIVQFRA